jgi:hypothetical protein
MKIIKQNIIFLFLGISLLYWGCTEPTDVQANRIIFPDTTKTKPIDTTAPFCVNTLNLEILVENFNPVYPSTYSKPLFISNNTDKQLEIKSCVFSQNKNLFRISEPTIPFILEPKGYLGSTNYITITFVPNGTGKYYDTLIINNLEKTKIAIQGIVPNVVVTNLDFGSIPVDSTDQRVIKVINNSTKNIILNSVKITDPDGVFTILYLDFPLTISYLSPANVKNIVVNFQPKAKKQYQAKFEFDIDAVGLVDNTAEITGAGI